MTGAVNRDMPDNCGLGHDVDRTSCEAAARAIIANRGDPYRLRDAAEYVLGLLDDERVDRAPRVWLPGDTVPAGTWVTDRHGDEDPPFCFDRDTVIAESGDVLVEVLVPDFAAAVAAERARRALSATVPPAEAGSGNGAGEARSAVSGRPGASQRPSEGEGSDR